MLGAFGPLLPGSAHLLSAPALGTAAITLGAETTAAAGGVRVTGAAAIALGAVTAAAAGELTPISSYAIPYRGILRRSLIARNRVPNRGLAGQ